MPAINAANEQDVDERTTQSNQRFQALLKSLDGTSSKGRKQKHAYVTIIGIKLATDGTSIYRDALDPYLSSARFFRLNFDLFVDFNTVLRDGMQAEFDPMWVNDDQSEEYVSYYHWIHSF